MPNRKVQIKEVFREFKDLFDDKTNLNDLSIKSSSNGEEIYVPYPISMNSYEGVELKESAGCIAIQEKLDKKGGIVSYRYKYFLSEYEYLICSKHKDKNNDHCGVFNFHYDKDENNNPHKPHVTVLFPSIRYISEEITLKEFLMFIKEHFFENREGLLCRKNFTIWDSRF